MLVGDVSKVELGSVNVLGRICWSTGCRATGCCATARQASPPTWAAGTVEGGVEA